MTTVIAKLIKDDTAQAGDVFCRGRSPVFALCRSLFAAGADPGSRLECYRGTTLALVVKSIGRGAKLIVKEPDRGRIHIGMGGVSFLSGQAPHCAERACRHHRTGAMTRIPASTPAHTGRPRATAKPTHAHRAAP
jgi:hypothetical protein